MEDFNLAQDAGMWDSDLQTLNKALIHAKDGLIRQPEQLTMEVKLHISPSQPSTRSHGVFTLRNRDRDRSRDWDQSNGRQ